MRRGVIAIILRPEVAAVDGTPIYTGKHVFYCLDHNGYQHDDRRIKAGIGLMSETFEPGETDVYTALARSYVEEILGIKAIPDNPNNDFNARVEEVCEGIMHHLTDLGTFEYAFNYTDPTRYLTHPDTIASVMVLLDDDCMLPVGSVEGSEEVHYAGYLGKEDLDHPYIRYRTGYNTRHVLATPQLAAILDAAGIEVAE